jgi:hypothetical protein
MRLFRRRLPEAPKNARLFLLDGTDLPLELRYVGKSAGIHCWTPTNRMPAFEDINCLYIEELPAHTTLVMSGSDGDNESDMSI